MSDMGEVFRDLRDYRKEVRRLYAVKCPKCQQLRPRAEPTRLLPGQKCFDGYKDTRKSLTDDQRNVWGNKS